MRMDGIGNPFDDANKAARHVQDELKAIGADVDVKPLLLFTDPDVELDIEKELVPILYSGEKRTPNLTEYLRELNRQQKDNMQQKATLPLTDEQIQAFEANTVNK